MSKFLNELFTSVDINFHYSLDPNFGYWILVLFSIAMVFTLLSYANYKYWSFRYQKVSSLFTLSERKLLFLLEDVLGDKYRVFGKVRVADVIRPRKKTRKRFLKINLRRTRSRHFDFVICSRKKIEPLLCIEVYSPSFLNGKRKKRNKEISNVCSSAQLPILWISSTDMYDYESLKLILEEALTDSDFR